MNTTLIRPLKLKSGREFPIGTAFAVIPHLNDTHAMLFHEDSEEPFILNMVSLYKYFPEFIQVTDDLISTAMMDGEIPSLTGETEIEPDGHDSDGWPSILAACGLI